MTCFYCNTDDSETFETTFKGDLCENCLLLMPHEDYVELFDDDGMPRESEDEAV